MERTQTRSRNMPRRFETGEDMVAHLEAAFEEDDIGSISAALGDIARARPKGMRNVAEATGLGRESLYKSLSPTGNPELATVLKVMRALGLRLRATSASGTAEQ